MSSLLETKNKIESTKNTKKITKAMQLVAASKMKVFQRTSQNVKISTTDLLKTLGLCGTGILDVEFAKRRETGKTLFVLLTSDKGLCGAMNARLTRHAFRSKEWLSLSPEDRLLMTVGRKAKDAAKTQGVIPVASFQGLQEQMSIVDALEVIGAILEPWMSEEVKQVYLIAPEYVNAFTFQTTIRSYLPLTPEIIQRQLNERVPGIILPERSEEASFIEPNLDRVVAVLAQRVVESLFVEAFYELKATEYSSRMVAMKNATEAADDRIRYLTRLFNKARQDAITRQLSELAAASEAMTHENTYEIYNV